MPHESRRVAWVNGDRDRAAPRRSVVRYAQMERKQWVLFKEGGRPAAPAQIILLTLAINYVQGVEDAFTKMQEGNANGPLAASCGAFTPSTRLVSRRGGRAWSHFRV